MALFQTYLQTLLNQYDVPDALPSALVHFLRLDVRQMAVDAAIEAQKREFKAELAVALAEQARAQYLEQLARPDVAKLYSPPRTTLHLQPST